MLTLTSQVVSRNYIDIYLAFDDIQISVRRRRKLFPPDETGVDS